ncbi:MAG: hypothetical protein KKH70_20590 [Gammaproteobacteria bacterium]|nr:hypothetical protein [Gammaproteobacteria bacterium]
MKLFQIYKPTVFKDILSCIGALNEDVTLQLDYEGLKIITMDTSHVAMVNLKLPNSFFDEYPVNETVKIGVNIPTVLKALGKITKNDDYLDAEYTYTMNTKEIKNDEGQVIASSQIKSNEKLVLTLIGDIRRKKTVPCLEPLDTEVPEPRIFFKSKTRIVLKTLKRIVDDFDGQHLTIETDEENIKFSSSHDDYDEETPLNKDNDNIIEHRVEESSKTTYTMSYVIQILRPVVKVSEVGTLEYSEDMPFKLDVELPQGTLEYFLAPCIGV